MLICFILFMYFSSLLVFSLNRKLLLLMLWSLESCIVASYIGFLVLTMSVCEGALGLSLLVLMVRVHGNDFILSFNSLCLVKYGVYVLFVKHEH